MQFYAILKAYTIIWNHTVKISEENGYIVHLVCSATDVIYSSYIYSIYELYMKLSN